MQAGPQPVQLSQPPAQAAPGLPGQPAAPGQFAPSYVPQESSAGLAPSQLPPPTLSAPSAPLLPPPAAVLAESATTGPLPTTPPPGPATLPSPALPDPAAQPGALSKLTGAVRGRRAARKPRLAMSAVFADLVDMADIPRSAYAVDEEVTGAMCLFKTDGGYEVFSCAEDARHEVRFFEDEEAAYFYLFGVLSAEALRNGRLSPRRN
jgi:hypothetical protein